MRYKRMGVRFLRYGHGRRHRLPVPDRVPGRSRLVAHALLAQLDAASGETDAHDLWTFLRLVLRVEAGHVDRAPSDVSPDDHPDGARVRHDDEA